MLKSHPDLSIKLVNHVSVIPSQLFKPATAWKLVSQCAMMGIFVLSCVGKCLHLFDWACYTSFRAHYAFVTGKFSQLTGKHMAHANGSGPGWGEVMHILHHTQSREPLTVGDLPAAFSCCSESIQSRVAEKASWGSAETWPRSSFFPVVWVKQNFVDMNWTDSGSAHINLPMNGCRKCEVKPSVTNVVKGDMGSNNWKKLASVAARQLDQSLNDQNVNI